MSILLRNLKEIYHLKSSNFKLADLILEQEEADEEPEEENPFEDDEEADDEDKDTDDADAKEDDDAEKEEDDKAKPSIDDVSIDTDIEAVFIDFETEARKNVAERFMSMKDLSLLYEQAEDDKFEEIDIDVFSSEVARLVKNYDTLLDMEKMLVDKAKEFISSRYGEKAETALVDKLAQQHDIDLDEPQGLPVSNLDTPVAVGAASGAAVGE